MDNAGRIAAKLAQGHYCIGKIPSAKIDRLAFERKVIQSYLSGMSWDSLCWEYDIGNGSVNWILNKHGIQKRRSSK